MRGYRTETLSSVYDLPLREAMDPLPLPSPAGIFYAYNRRPRSSREYPNNITLDVESKRVLVFSSDDSERIDTSALRRSDYPNREPCERLFVGQTMFFCVAAVLQVSSVIAIIVQRRIYRRNLRALVLRSEARRY